MKKLWCILASTALLNGCAAQPSGNNLLNADSFEKGIQQSHVQILDVRTAGEFKDGHIKNALQADWNNATQFRDRTQYLDKNKPIYVYCLAGGRSAAAAKWLREQGYPEVYDLAGGFNSWRRSGKPIEGDTKLPEMTLNEYEALIKSHPVVLVDFGASWCPPCKRMEPILDAVLKEKGSGMKLVKVDGGRDLEVMKALQVEALPVFIIYKDGKPAWRQQGVVSREVLLQNL